MKKPIAERAGRKRKPEARVAVVRYIAPEAKKDLLDALARHEGHVRAVRRMVEEEQCCEFQAVHLRIDWMFLRQSTFVHRKSVLGTSYSVPGMAYDPRGTVATISSRAYSVPVCGSGSVPTQWLSTVPRSFYANPGTRYPVQGTPFNLLDTRSVSFPIRDHGDRP